MTTDEIEDTQATTAIPMQRQADGLARSMAAHPAGSRQKHRRPTGPCTVCGATGSCGEDEQGRSWTHLDSGYITTAFVFAVCIAGALFFLAALGPMQQLMCATHRTAGHGALEYCSDYQPVRR